MFVRLPQMLEQPEQTLEWHYNSRCKSCHWRMGCHQRSEQEQTVSMIPDLSLENSKLLRSVFQFHSTEEGMTDIEELGRLTSRNTFFPFEQSSPFTAKQVRRLLGMSTTGYGDSAVVNAIKTCSAQVPFNAAQLNVATRSTDLQHSSQRGLCSHHLPSFGPWHIILARDSSSIRFKRFSKW